MRFGFASWRSIYFWYSIVALFLAGSNWGASHFDAYCGFEDSERSHFDLVQCLREVWGHDQFVALPTSRITTADHRELVQSSAWMRSSFGGWALGGTGCSAFAANQRLPRKLDALVGDAVTLGGSRSNVREQAMYGSSLGWIDRDFRQNRRRVVGWQVRLHGLTS